MANPDTGGACRACGRGIAPFMTFGRMPIANGFLMPDQLASEYFYELAPAFCEPCGLFQLMTQPPVERMFHDHYAFFSSSSSRMQQHFKALADMVSARVLASRRDPLVVEIGSNDGCLLRHWRDAGYRHVGVEPASNVAAVARAQGLETIGALFDEALAEQIVLQHGHADAVVAANALCHIPDINGAAAGITRLLAPDGVVIVEDPYLLDMIAKTAYDQIYDEHVFLFSATTIARVFARHGLDLVDVLPQATHGGSMRYVLAKRGEIDAAPAVAGQVERERAAGLAAHATYDRFRLQCETSRAELRRLLDDLRKQTHRIVGYAATSKSTTVTNYCGIGPEHLEFVSDTTPIKHGTLTPGMHIPVKPHEAFLADPPDYALLFAWNHAEEIFAKERAFHDAGGRWITFVPRIALI